MRFEDIKKIFSRYSTKERISSISYLSYCALGFENLSIEKKRRYKPKPWDVDTFISFCIACQKQSLIQRNFFSKEWESDLKHFLDFVSESDYVKKWIEDIEKKGLQIVMGPLYQQQLPYQIHLDVLMFRYNFIFMHDDIMKTNMKKYLGVDDFIEYAFLGQLPSVGFKQIGRKDIDSFLIFDKLMYLVLKRHIKAIMPLVKTRYELIEIQKQWCDLEKVEELVFSYKVNFMYPLIKEGEDIFLYSPHTLARAVTDEMFIHLTDFDTKMKNHIGKNVLEDYIELIIKESNLYGGYVKRGDTISYGKKGSNLKASDIIVQSNGVLLFFEIKTFVPWKKSRINDEKASKKELEKMVKNVKQVLDRYHDFKAGYYQPFDDSQSKEVYIIIATLFEVNIDLYRLINTVIEDESYSNDKDFLLSHLLVTTFYCLESFFLYKKDIIPDLLLNSGTNSLNNIRYYKGNRMISDRIPSFAKSIDNITNYAIKEINKVSIEEFNEDLDKIFKRDN